MLAQLRPAYDASARAQLRTAYETTAGLTPTITTTTLPDARVGVAYSQTIAATGDTPISFSIDSGALPAGIALNASTGALTGTPTAPARAQFDVRASNSVGSDVQSLEILAPNEGVALPLPIVTTVTLVPAQQTVDEGTTVDLIVTVDDEAGDAMQGLIGAITAAGCTAQQVAATDAAGSARVRLTNLVPGSATVSIAFDGVASNQASITVNALNQAPVITTASLPNAIRNQAYSQTLTATGPTPITWSVISGSLPAGLSLAASTGVISGTPTVLGPNAFTVRAENSFGHADKALSLYVATDSTITSVAVSPATVTIAPGAQTQLVADVVGTSGFDPAVTWSAQSGGGSVSSSGLYTAPAAPTTAVVRATSTQDPTKFDESTVTVEAPAAADALIAPAIRIGQWVGSTITVKARVTVLSGSAEGLTVSAVSNDPARVAVSPVNDLTDADGYAEFQLAFLAGGFAVLTFTSGALSAQTLAIARTG